MRHTITSSDTSIILTKMLNSIKFDLQPLPIWDSTVDKIEDIKNSFAKERGTHDE